MAENQISQDVAKACAAVTPADGADLSVKPTRGLMVGADGDVSVIFMGDTSAVTLTLKAGVVYPFAVNRVRSTGTTATGIKALY